MQTGLQALRSGASAMSPTAAVSTLRMAAVTATSSRGALEINVRHTTCPPGGVDPRIHFYNQHRIHTAIGGTPYSGLNNLPGHHI
jgi:hypothetical protein